MAKKPQLAESKNHLRSNDQSQFSDEFLGKTEPVFQLLKELG